MRKVVKKLVNRKRSPFFTLRPLFAKSIMRRFVADKAKTLINRSRTTCSSSFPPPIITSTSVLQRLTSSSSSSSQSTAVLRFLSTSSDSMASDYSSTPVTLNNVNPKVDFLIFYFSAIALIDLSFF